LTDEQLDLIYEHWLLDTKPPGVQDNEYTEPESFHDPDFEESWNDTDESCINKDNNIIPQIDQKSISDVNDWKEVE